jgi:hypothetical protein
MLGRHAQLALRSGKATGNAIMIGNNPKMIRINLQLRIKKEIPLLRHLCSHTSIQD